MSTNVICMLKLTRCGANVLVPLGGTALFALTRKIGITNWRAPSCQQYPNSKEGKLFLQFIPVLHYGSTYTRIS